jgi:hypothetical protein
MSVSAPLGSILNPETSLEPLFTTYTNWACNGADNKVTAMAIVNRVAQRLVLVFM